MHFTNQRILITGGSSGIGLALAKQLSALGAHVCILARRDDLLQASLIAITASRKHESQRFSALKADVANHEDVSQVIRGYIESEGAIDILINSAGVVEPGVFQELTPRDFEWNMAVNFHGTVNATLAVIQPMLARGSGVIVNISSMAGFLGIYGYTAYSASKYAVRGFSDALRGEMKPRGIRVHLVFPPDTDTPQLAYDNAHKPTVTKELSGIAKALSPEYVAAAILKGIAQQRYIITPGFDATLYYHLANFVGPLVYPIMDRLISVAMRSERSAHHQRRQQESAHPDEIRHQ
ncbi:MAG: SDR family oxidoreductase [Anaerolineaceae bacterium]|jgi:3-dehydrosphinganine reductase